MSKQSWTVTATLAILSEKDGPGFQTAPICPCCEIPLQGTICMRCETPPVTRAKEV